MNNLLRHIRLVDLELLITTAHHNNISKAASAHNLSQSAASAAIQRVETAFGQKLFHHETRQFRLTHEGSVLIPKIEGWLKQFEDKIAIQDKPPLRLVTTHAIARVILPRLLAIESVDVTLARPDRAYKLVLKDDADVAIVPDNAPWTDVSMTEVGAGSFGLYSSQKNASISPVLLPENQIEVLHFLQRWNQLYNMSLQVKARIPSWSLIADLCSTSAAVGFLPDFLAREHGLCPISQQPDPLRFRLLAISRLSNDGFSHRFKNIIDVCQETFKEG